MKCNENNNIAEFLGWHMGDGCISITKRYSEYTLTGDIKEERQFYEDIIIPTFNKIFKDILKKPVILKHYKSVGVCGIYIFDREFVSVLQERFNIKHGKKLNVGIPIKFKSNTEKKNFLRGIFDTDGSIYFCKSNIKTRKESLNSIFHYKPKIKLATISKKLIDDVYKLLVELGYGPRLYKPRKQRKNEKFMHAIVLDTKRDTMKWIKEIGFKNMKHTSKINVWKKYGFCPPHTTLKERCDILDNKLNPLKFYPKHRSMSLRHIKENLNCWWK